jgi:VIT1/CCC1 family predicted Fe2+/Mn2+ transporter
MRAKVNVWRDNWQRELEGAYLYGKLSRTARRPETKQAMLQMSAQESEHAAMWAEQARAADAGIRIPGIDLRIRIIALLGRWLGSEAVLNLLINDEVGDIAAYSDQARNLGYDKSYSRVLRDETSHARALSTLKKSNLAEPWHRGARAGGLLRDIVYGFNDGLTANFGLVMGVVGAAVNNNIILLTGFAGMLADALSMAASGFLAARSEQEVSQHHLELEAAELSLMPQEEREELVTFYTQKGLTRHEAVTVADRLMQKPDVALTTLAREELGIDTENPTDPLRGGVITGISTGLGSVIPILPFLFLSGAAAIWTGVVISMAAHFAVGASRAIFTGRPAIRSGFEMFAVGMGVAVLTYLLGLLLGVRF